MFGTVARWRMKPGAEAWLAAQSEAMRAREVPGWVSTTIFRDVSDPAVVWIAVVFKDEETYRANAASNLQNVEYERLRSAMDGEPEWHDGHVVGVWTPLHTTH